MDHGSDRALSSFCTQQHGRGEVGADWAHQISFLPYFIPTDLVSYSFRSLQSSYRWTALHFQAQLQNPLLSPVLAAYRILQTVSLAKHDGIHSTAVVDAIVAISKRKRHLPTHKPPISNPFDSPFHLHPPTFLILSQCRTRTLQKRSPWSRCHSSLRMTQRSRLPVSMWTVSCEAN